MAKISIVTFTKAAAPAAGTTFCNVGIGAAPFTQLQLFGYYKIDVTLYIDGTTVAAVDDDNFNIFLPHLFNSPRQLAVPSNGMPVKYSFISQALNPAQGGGGNVVLTAIATASAGTIYHAELTATLIDGEADMPDDALCMSP